VSKRPYCVKWRRRAASTLLLELFASSCGVRADKSPNTDSFDFATPAQSRVIDSVAGTINTDSLYRAYHSMLSDPHPEEVLPLIGCIEQLLMWRHGMYPAERAIARMRDTLWRGADSAANAMLARLPSSGVVDENHSLCGPFGERGPLTVDGFPMDPLASDSSSRRHP